MKRDPSISILSNDDLPEITIVLCIYNSADLLKKRINDIFATNYPKDKLNILIVSDGSKDNPEAIVDSLNSSNLRLVGYKQNKGKAYAISFAQKYITTPFTAFTDIRQSFDADALNMLASKLANPEIGAVSGNLKIITPSGDGESGLYWQYEKAIRQKESDFHSLLGVTGAIYMAKTELLPTIPEDSLLDDMYIPLSIVKQGYLVKFCAEAIAYDNASSTVEEEFARKVRTLAGNYQLINQLPWLLSFRQNPLFFQFMSHKVARLLLPCALITLFVSSLYLPSEYFYLAMFQILFYSYSLIGYLNQSLADKLPLMNSCVSFCNLNLAALIAMWKYFTVKDITTLWKKH